MRLNTPDLARVLPPLCTSEAADPIVPVKFFQPWGAWTWYATEYNPIDRIFFGRVDGFESELGYFSLDELESIRGPGGLTIERDLHWKPKPLSECGK